MKYIKHNLDPNVADPYWEFNDNERIINWGWSEKHQNNFVVISCKGVDKSVLYSGDNITSNMMYDLVADLKDFFKSDCEVYEMPDWITRRFALQGGKERIRSDVAKKFEGRFKK